MSAPLRVVVVDDEEMARRRLVRLLRAIDHVAIEAELASGPALLAWLDEHEADVVLLDIQMPGLSGLDAAKTLQDQGLSVVLSTAHPDHALEAFECGAADYLVKPVEGARLERALQRARHLRAVRSVGPGAAVAAAAPALTRLAISTRQGFVLLDPREISHAILEGELVSIVTRDASFLSDQPLSHIQERLPRDLFERVHRKALLNLEHVVRLSPCETGGFVAHTRDGSSVEVSRQAARELRRA
jgi:two-component system LytT family response regulator